MDVIFWVAGGFIVACMIFAAGYHTAVREAGKEIRFLKDCVKNLRGLLYDAEKAVEKAEARNYDGPY